MIYALIAIEGKVNPSTVIKYLIKPIVFSAGIFDLNPLTRNFEPTPIPIKAFPLSFITALTSAKSKFTNPATAIKSDID